MHAAKDHGGEAFTTVSPKVALSVLKRRSFQGSTQNRDRLMIAVVMSESPRLNLRRLLLRSSLNILLLLKVIRSYGPLHRNTSQSVIVTTKSKIHHRHCQQFQTTSSCPPTLQHRGQSLLKPLLGQLIVVQNDSYHDRVNFLRYPRLRIQRCYKSLRPNLIVQIAY